MNYLFGLRIEWLYIAITLFICFAIFLILFIIMFKKMRSCMRNYSSLCSPWMFGRNKNQFYPFHSDVSDIDEEKILRRRLASGEIDAEEFSKIMDILNKKKA